MCLLIFVINNTVSNNSRSILFIFSGGRTNFINKQNGKQITPRPYIFLDVTFGRQSLVLVLHMLGEVSSKTEKFCKLVYANRLAMGDKLVSGMIQFVVKC